MIKNDLMLIFMTSIPLPCTEFSQVDHGGMSEHKNYLSIAIIEYLWHQQWSRFTNGDVVYVVTSRW